MADARLFGARGAAVKYLGVAPGCCPGRRPRWASPANVSMQGFLNPNEVIPASVAEWRQTMRPASGYCSGANFVGAIVKRILVGAALLGTSVSAQAADMAVKAPYHKAPVASVY